VRQLESGSFGQFLSDFAEAVELAQQEELPEGYQALFAAQMTAEEAASGDPMEQQVVAYRYEVARRIFLKRYATPSEALALSARGDRSSSKK
jgi:hypothetical protein